MMIIDRDDTFSFIFTVAALAALAACSDGAEIVGVPGDEADPSGAAGTSAGSSAGAPGAPAMAGAGNEAASNTSPTGVGGAWGGGSGGATPSDPASNAGGAGASAASVNVIPPRGPCEVAERVGRFAVERQVDFGVIQGAVAEGVVPTAVPELVLDQGSCRVLERRNLVCLPACVGAETCGESGSCIPYPRQISVGDVTISGLTQATLMSPLQPGNSYFAPGADNPPYAVGSDVVLSAQGGDVPGFQLFGVGSEPLVSAPSWVLQAGAELELAWAAPSVDVGTTVLVELTIDQHGASPLSLSCEFPDTGSASVPAALVDLLIGAGVSGFPNGRVTRRTADHVDLEIGCVELDVGSPLAASVSVSGYTPCNGSGDCPSGQECNVAFQRCE